MKKFKLGKVFKLALVAIVAFVVFKGCGSAVAKNLVGKLDNIESNVKTSFDLEKMVEAVQNGASTLVNTVATLSPEKDGDVSKTPTPTPTEAVPADWKDGLTLSGPYKVDRVVDGDTLVLDINGTLTKIRLIGVDTPESVHTNASKNVAQGATASDYTKSIVTNKSVYVEFDAGLYDKYGRTLAYVYLKDGRMLNEMLLEDGMAKMMTIQPNVKYVERFQTAQEYAQEQENGFWLDYFVQ